MHVACDGWCAGVKVESCGPSNRSNKGIERRWQDLCNGLVRSPWKSHHRMLRWLGYVVVSVLSVKQASACFARSRGK